MCTGLSWISCLFVWFILDVLPGAAWKVIPVLTIVCVNLLVAIGFETRRLHDWSNED